MTTKVDPKVSSVANTAERDQLACAHACASSETICPACGEQTTWPLSEADFKDGWDARDAEVSHLKLQRDVAELHFKDVSDENKRLREALEDIANFQQTSIDKISLMNYCDGYRERAKRALALKATR